MNAQLQPAAAPSPYAVFYFPELISGEPDRQALLLPLTFVYLLSMHVRFVLPIRKEQIPVVESILDEVLAGHSLESKGISYMEVGSDAVGEAMRSSTLLVTTEAGAAMADTAKEIPLAMVFTTQGKGPCVRLRNPEKIANEGLKAKVVGCAQLINIQSGGFMSEGHFSLSW